MKNAKLAKAIRLGLMMAEGKPIDEAVQEMMDCLELVLPDMEADAPLSNSIKQQIKAPVINEDVPTEAMPPLQDLAPITPSAASPTKKPPTRVYWDIEELQTKLVAETPAYMDIKVDKDGNEIRIFRKLLQQNGPSPGIQLAYGPQTQDPRVPFPKASFWATTEIVDVPVALKEIEAAAISMYQVRPMPQTKLVADRPLRFNIGAEVE